MAGTCLKNVSRIGYAYAVNDLRKVLAQVERITLSLKNIYRLLMNDDFPVYSDRVIGKKQRKGQTLLRFWKDMMVHEFCALPYGKTIWREDGMRSRSFSNLCNRNDELKIYHEYARELGSCISADTLLHQIELFEHFLLGREYSDAALRYRLKALLHLLEDDECVTGAICDHLKEIFGVIMATANSEPEISTFRMSCLLTVMTLYAAAGLAMGDSTMAALRDDALGMDALWQMRRQKQQQGSRDVRILTAYTGLLQDTNLSRNHFFGREADLFNLQDLAASGKKCLISGIGGVGKTELLRQLIRRCVEERLVDKLAIIPYRTDLAESVLYAFPQLRQPGQEETLNVVLHRLEAEAQEGSLLVLVDNVTGNTDSDVGLARLAQLPCTVMLTSRRKQMEGFEAYPLSVPNTDACELIFRDNYGSPLTEADRQELRSFLSDPAFCHPLILRLIARAAKSKNWSVAELHQSLAQSSSLTWMEEGRQIRLGQILTQWYPASQIPSGCGMLIQLFTLLPRDNYPVDMLLEYFPQLFPDEKELSANLAMLVSRSLLEQHDGGYSMHPVIAQCMRQKNWSESRLEPFLSGLKPCLLEPKLNIEALLKQQWIGQIFIEMLRYLSGNISPAMLLTLMDAIEIQTATPQQGVIYHQWLSRLLEHCPDRDDTVEVAWNRLLCLWQMAREETVQALFEQQEKNASVPVRRYLDLCEAFAHQFQMSNPKLTERMLKVILDTQEAPPRFTACAYRRLGFLAQANGQFEETLSWLKAGAEFISQHPQCGNLLWFESLDDLANLYLIFGQGQEAKVILDELGTQEKLLTIPDNRINYLNALSMYETNFGSLETALQLSAEHLNLVDFYYGKNSEYYVSLGQYASILLQMKRYDQAKAAFEETLEYGKDHPLFTVVRNNYAVLLLDMGQPEEALPVIGQVLAIAREQGGIALGEALRNKARAHGMLGDDAQERECLEEALPLLEQAYGPEHARPTAARERLAQLREQEAQNTQP